jgi:hypothetical protein
MQIPRLAGALLLGAAALPAQTTGVVGVNDLTMILPPVYIPVGSGTVSCSTFVTTGAVGTNVVAFALDAPTATTSLLLVSPISCVPQFFPFLPTAPAACAGPAAGTPVTNLWLSLGVGGPFPLPIPGITSPAGITRWNFNITWPIPPLWFQGFMLDACSPTTFKFSQAMGFQ